MERLRYVARAGSGDTALIVGETVEAIARLRPGPAELVTLCRQLVQRNPTCGPLWWLGSRLLSGDVEDLWDLVDEVDEDPTADHLVDAVPDGSRVLTIGCPDIASRALARRGDIEVLAVDAGAGAAAFMRALDRADVPVRSVDVTALPSAAARADLVVVEVAACSTAVGLAAVGNALLSVVAAATAAPRVVVTGVGTRLPDAYVDTIVARSIDPDAPWSADVERIDLTAFDADRDLVVGPAGAGPVGAETLRPDCPFVPELIPPSPA
jgi:hypothetical protein